ncbi:hypothetical protein [Nocardioides sp. zg-1228]|uniref:hypothetical protein n=1 Tax=Nocardioides sp. zg-1228 TaxID=2763008 RepID=UPI001642864E|nr:hypothetical protein [Nocardioides sp. zg-1228]MBC2932894.1 hypothetical protein [Nocardioides sp. zg-1228]QSF56899.1 hypothetical protein JX575_15080 [Nocardioides sp. zg-1228]
MTTMAITARPSPRPGLRRRDRTGRRLRVIGVTVLAAAALGSVLSASPAATDAPATDTACRMDIVGSYWFSSGCADESGRTAR